VSLCWGEEWCSSVSKVIGHVLDDHGSMSGGGRYFLFYERGTGDIFLGNVKIRTCL
jgi:hypothetical protein